MKYVSYCIKTSHVVEGVLQATNRTARRQFQDTGQPVSRMQTTDAMTSRLPCYEAKCVQLVSWSLTSLFSTNMAISETKGQGWKVIRTQWRKASDILTSTLAWPPFCSAASQKRERDREAHINYYASAYNRGDNYRITRLKLNRRQHNKHMHP